MIPEDWEIKALDEKLELLKDGSHNPPKRKIEGIKFIAGASDIKYRNIDFLNCTYISEGDYNSIHKYYEVKENDVLLTIVGTIGNSAIVKKSDLPFSLQRSIAILRPKKELYFEFLFYWINSPKFKQLLNSRVNPTAQPGIYLGELGKLKIPLPSIIEQQYIAKILSELDSKIELNQQMNKTLEAIGQALFKHWFVDFEFPNEKGEPYKSSGGEMVDSELGKIPRAWKVGKLGNFVNIIKGVSYKSEELKDSDKALVTLKSIDRGGGLNKNGFKEFIGKYKREQEIIDGDIVVAHTDITQKAEVLGKPAIVRMIQEYNTLIASLDLSIVRPKNNITNKPFLYYLLKSKNFQNHAFGYANGTTVLHLSSKAVPEYLFVVPDEQLLLKFGDAMEKLLDKKKKSEAETENLILVRELLLPKLMSGKIRVPIEVRR